MLTGFGHGAILSHAETIVNAVKSGAIKRFFVVGGCDGAEAERSYFKDVANGVPKEAVVVSKILVPAPLSFVSKFLLFKSSRNAIPFFLFFV